MRGSAVRVPSPAPGAVPSGAGGTLRGGKRSGRGAGSSRGQGGSVPAARTLRTHFLWDGGCLSLLPAAAGCFGRRLRACRASTAEKRTTGAGVRVAAQPPRPPPTSRRGTFARVHRAARSRRARAGPAPVYPSPTQPCPARLCPAPPARLPRRVRAPGTGRQQRHLRSAPPHSAQARLWWWC